VICSQDGGVGEVGRNGSHSSTSFTYVSRGQGSKRPLARDVCDNGGQPQRASETHPIRRVDQDRGASLPQKRQLSDGSRLGLGAWLPLNPCHMFPRLHPWSTQNVIFSPSPVRTAI